MNWLESVILGLIQGLTEFIPISSSGHLVLAQNFLAGASDHLFLESINIGTTLALIIYFRHKIIDILRDIFLEKNYRLARNIILTALPAGIVGLALSDFIGKSEFFGSVYTVVVTLFVVGVAMVLAEKIPHASSVNGGEALSPARAVIIGLAQTLALIPGVSRSGATILAGRFSGLKPAEAAEYSFLVSIPIMLGVTAKLFVTDIDYLLANAAVLTVSNIAALLSGLLAVGFLMKYLSKHSLAVFGWYRIVLSVVISLVLLVQ